MSISLLCFFQVSQCVRKKEEPYRNLRRGCRTVSADCVSTIITFFLCFVNFVGSVAVACPQTTHELFKKQFYLREWEAKTIRALQTSQQEITAIFCVLIGKSLFCQPRAHAGNVECHMSQSPQALLAAIGNLL